MKPKETILLLDRALDSSGSATSHRIRCGLAEMYPDKAVLETDEGELDPWALRTSGLAEVTPAEDIPSGLVTRWLGPGAGIHTTPETSVLTVRWNEQSLIVVQATWSHAFQPVLRRWIVADSTAVAESFFTTATEWCHAPKEEVLAFNGGCWSKSKELYRAISAASFDDLILAGDLKAAIRADFERFLASRSEYERYRVPWKRGVLFVGPPGNGKTHCLRASVKFLNVPCLYVQSLQSRYEPDDANILKVFKHARSVTPCCLVFEDLDAMITPHNRSFFLNQLDGFSDNRGILTLATTNHPERLDPAILSRPSRFDRKYHFELPRMSERLAYAAMWNARFEGPMHLGDEEVAGIAAAADGFSFAYIKELFVSSMMAWMVDREPGTMPRIMREQLSVLREHMSSEASMAVDSPTGTGVVEAMQEAMKRFF